MPRAGEISEPNCLETHQAALPCWISLRLGTAKHALRICGIPELLLYQEKVILGNLPIRGLFNPICKFTVFFEKLKSGIWLSHTESIKHRSKFGLSYIAIA